MEAWQRDWVDYYEELGVSRTASDSVIRAAYRAMAKDFHPDRGAGDHDRMRRINDAHAVLSDPARRRLYNAAFDGREASRRREADPTGHETHAAPNEHATTAAQQPADRSRKSHPSSATTAATPSQQGSSPSLFKLPLVVVVLALLGVAVVVIAITSGSGDNESTSGVAASIQATATRDAQRQAARQAGREAAARSLEVQRIYDDMEYLAWLSDWPGAIQLADSIIDEPMAPADLDEKRASYVEEAYVTAIVYYSRREWNDAVEWLEFLIAIDADYPDLDEMYERASREANRIS